MTEAFADESALVGMLAPSSASRRVEVTPEMLDYDFVQNCHDRDELRAVHRALVAREHGCYPHLEECVRDRLASLPRPRDDRPSVSEPPSTQSQEQTDAHHRNALGDWLDGLAKTKRPPQDDDGLPVTRVQADLAPLRKEASSTTEEGKGGVDEPRMPDGQGAPQIPCSSSAVFRKEKLSTKEYYDKWAKFNSKLSEDDDDSNVPATGARGRAPLERARSTTKPVASPPLPSAVDQERAKGRAALSAGNNMSAHAHFTRCIEVDESDPSGYSDRAQASMRMGNDNDAIVDLTRAISLDPKNAGAHAQRARLCHKHGQYESAVADFEKAHALDPSAGYDRLAGASNHEMIGEMRESQTFHSLTIEEVDGDEDECERERSLVEGGFGGLANVTNADAPTRRDTPPHSFDADEGGAYGATAMTGQDDDAKYSDSLLKRVEVELVADDIAEATQLVSSPNADAVKLKEEGNAALRRGDAESALRFYDASLELEPRNAIVLNNRAQAHSNLGKWENALKDTGKCLAIESDNTKALFRSGIAKLNLRPGDRSGIEDALADFQRAMSLNPPKNQVGLLAKKIADCKQLLASLSSRGGNASTKRRVTRDTDSLAF